MTRPATTTPSTDGAGARRQRTPVRQHTLRSAVGGRGIGLHSGAEIDLLIRPGRPGTGIIIRRTDVLNGGATIPVSWRNVAGSRMATTVGNEYGITVSTIEHLMAALAGCGVDNAVVEVDAAEIPVMDGSAAPFVAMIERAGLVEQNAPRQAIQILRPVHVGDDTKNMSIHPSPVSRISFEIDFEESAIRRQSRTVTLDSDTFRTEIARARTFGFEHEVDQLRRNGLARGGSLDNAVVISAGGILNKGGLRYDDEFVRHKILDCIGDLYLAGAPILGHVFGYRSGHAMTHALLKALFADGSAWRYVAATSHAEPQDWSSEPIAAAL